MMRRLAILSLVVGTLIACQTDSYEKGQGPYSLMVADLAELTTDGEQQGVAFTLDDGTGYTLTPPYTAQWMQTADTTYRVAIYYNVLTDRRAEAVSISPVPTLRPVEHWRMEQQPQDPIGVESAWLSANGRYINLGLLFRSGRIDDEEGMHTIGLAQDTIALQPDGRRTAHYRLIHLQGDTPEYYTNRHYISILLPAERPDTVSLSINTYGGPVERRFVLTHNNHSETYITHDYE